MWDEIRQCARGLLKSPGFTLLSAGTLALGIASTTALFSIVSSIVLNPLPYEDSGRLVKVSEVKRNEPVETARRPASFPNFADWRQRSRSLEHLAAVQEDVSFHLTGGSEPYRVEAARVSAEMFPLLGRKPIAGRTFSAAEDRPEGEPVVVLSYALWQHRFGADPHLVGQRLSLNGRQYTVIGVMPKDFHFPNRTVEMWAPLAMDPVNSSRWARFLGVYARLRPGVSLEKARQEMLGLAAQLEHENQGPDTDMTVDLVPLKKEVLGDAEKPLWLLLGAVGFVLLIALVNVTNLFLLRILGRERDIAVCTVLGSGQMRVIRRFLTESLLLSLLGGAGGLLLATWGVRLFVAISPESIPRLDEVAVNPFAIALTLLVTFLAALVLGLAPGLSLRDQRLGEVLRVGSRGTEGVARRRLRGLLVISEIALSVVLLVGAGLMGTSLLRLFQVRTGLRPDRVLTLQLTLPRAGYPEGAQKAAFFTLLLERVSGAPGIESAGLINHLPLSGSNTHWSFHIEGQPAGQPGQEPQVGYRVTDSGYFRTLGIPLTAGRLFTASDHQAGSTAALINRTMAERFWPRADALGKRLKLGEATATDQPWLTVVGIVGDVRHNGLASPVEPELFLPYSPQWFDPMTLVARTSGPPLSATNTIRSAVWELDRNLPLYNIKTMDQVLAESLSKERFNLVLMGTFAAIALVLALVGIYGIMAQSVAQQRQSIAVQIALGAPRSNVLVRVLRQGVRLIAVGVALGVLLAIGLSRLLSSLLFGVTATDPVIFGEVVLVFFIVALAAVYLPALRATRVDPMLCLKA